MGIVADFVPRHMRNFVSLRDRSSEFISQPYFEDWSHIGDMDAQERRPCDLWQIRSNGYKLQKEFGWDDGKTEDWISQRQKSYEFSYTINMPLDLPFRYVKPAK